MKGHKILSRAVAYAKRHGITYIIRDATGRTHCFKGLRRWGDLTLALFNYHR